MRTWSVRLPKDLTLNVGIAYTHARYREYMGSGLSGGPVIAPNYGFATLPTSFAGGEMIRAPEWTTNVGLNYLLPSGIGTWGASGNYFFSSRVPLMPGNQRSQDAYGLLSARVSWTSMNDAWTLSAYGNNLTDEKYQVFSAAGFLGNNHIYGAPLSWGAQIEYRF